MRTYHKIICNRLHWCLINRKNPSHQINGLLELHNKTWEDPFKSSILLKVAILIRIIALLVSNILKEYVSNLQYNLSLKMGSSSKIELIKKAYLPLILDSSLIITLKLTELEQQTLVILCLRHHWKYIREMTLRNDPCSKEEPMLKKCTHQNQEITLKQTTNQLKASNNQPQKKK